MPKGIKKENNKPRRVPVSGIRDIMTVYGKDPNFKYYWVKDKNDNGSRIQRFIRGGYEFARQEDEGGNYVIGEEAVYQSDRNGSIIRLPTGNAEFSYLMRIPLEYHLEDKADKEQRLLDLEKDLMRQAPSDGRSASEEGVYGTVKIARK